MDVSEKRREHRREGSGMVHVCFSNPQKQDIEGQLMDVSSSGFRMAHAYSSLATGQLVEFAHVEAKGRARVIWNRIVDGKVETGFLVVFGR
jgi:hypothetical protein